MVTFDRRFKCALVSMGFVLASSATALAATDYFKCLSESDTVFGENLAFGYDNQRNTILIQEHSNGPYTPIFTLGNVNKKNGQLAFVFEHWDKGSVATRDSYSLELATGHLSLKQDFFADNGAHLETGQTALGACFLVKGNDEQEAAKPSESQPAPKTAQVASEATLECHTEKSTANIAKSVSWCVLTALAEQPEESFGPDRFFNDGAWCEGEKGYGIGAMVEVSFEPYEGGGSPPFFDRLLISNGYDQSTQTFMENSRVKQIEIKTDDGQTLVRTLRDETGVQEVQLGGLINPRGILITILDVYPGQKYDDTCLSYVMADFKF